jgi:UDP-N-acetyl-D-mannosaminuronate dehydrogenase
MSTPEEFVNVEVDGQKLEDEEIFSFLRLLLPAGVETTYRAWMIACFQEMHRISKAFGADFDETVDFLEDTHRVRFDRPIMFPGVIGGHCLIPNTELLLAAYDSEFLRLILESNEKRKEEVKDKAIQKEIGKIAKRVEALEKKTGGSTEECS